ncbi:hypothetical protein J6590_062244 [Homalodisca vitripennis]|nr:hypothetical protein J6590_062244 [Homalodisca vitripennis]
MDHFVHPSYVLESIDTVVLSKTSLSKLEEMVAKCVLKKSVNRLSILQHLLPHSEIEWPEFYRSLPLRMTSLKRITLPEDRENYGVSLLKKVQKGCSFAQNVLYETVKELSFQGTYSYLEYTLCLENLHRFDDFILKQDSLDKDQLICLLKHKITNLKENFKKTESYLSGMMERCLEQAVVHAYVDSETLIRNTEVIQQARLDQNDLKLREKEKAVIAATDNYNLDVIEENRINSEVEHQLYYMTSVLQKRLDKMSNRYNTEVEALDVAILQLKSKQDEQNERFIELSELYRERQEIVDVFQKEMDIREKELEEKRIQNRAAIVIQQWWRHIMFMRLIKRRISIRKKPVKIHPIKANQTKKKKK